MFEKLLDQFDNNIMGLRDYVDLIQPILDEYHKKEQEKHDEAFLPFALAQKIEVEDDPYKKEELQEKLKEVFDGEIEVKVENLESSEEEPDKRFSFKVRGDTTKIDEAFEFQIKSTTQRNLLYVNSLISLLSSAEWFYSQLLHFYYDEHPNSAGIKNKTLTLEELKTFGSVSDAEKYLIDSKIENLLRSGFSDWINTLKSELKLGLGYITDFEDELIEIYQRRNLLVHNGGIVNSIYLSNVSKDFSEQISIEDKLTVDENYLENAISKIHVIFSLIACELWKKAAPKDARRADFLNEISYYYLKREEWEIAHLPNIFLKRDAKLPTIPKTVAELNCWLCLKRLEDPQKLISDIKDVDYSDKTILLKLALHALREEDDEFFIYLPRAIDNGDLKIEYLFDFPILEEMRNTEKFEKFIAENEKVQEYLKSHENGSNKNISKSSETNNANQADG